MSIQTDRAPVRCAQGLALDVGEDAPAVWQCVAYEGAWNGHPAGAFEFTRETFAQIVRNFRNDPRYARRAGQPPVTEATPEQIASGDYDVIQWDFHHAAEMPAAQVAADGAPAQGWALELKQGEFQGKAALFVLTRWLEPARSYIRAGRYKWCSVSVWFSAPDPSTGQDQGAVLTSIAVTNNPFLQGLPSLRAQRGVQADRYWFGPATDKEQAFANIRSLFALPETAGVADVIARLSVVSAWATAGGLRPAEIDEECSAEDVINGLRQILALPLLTATTDVLSQASELLASLMPATAPQLSAGGAGPQQENQIMTTNATGAPSGAKDAAAQPVAGALLVAGSDLRVTLAKLIAKRRNCSVDDVSDGHILAAMEGAADLQTQIDDLMSAIGAKTLAEALAKMSAAEELKMKLSEALAGKKAAEDAMQGMEDGMVEEDVGLALASLGVTDEAAKAKVRKALLAERGKTPETILAFRKTYDVDAIKKAAREKMIETAQRVTASTQTPTAQQDAPAPAHITASIATSRQTPTATPQDALMLRLGADGKVIVGSAPQSREAAPGEGGSITLASLRQKHPSEPNDYLRKVAFVKAEHAKNNPGAKPLDHVTACEMASQLRAA